MERDKKRLQESNAAPFATVLAVIQGRGVKIKIDGDESAVDTYYNSLQVVNVNDRVHIQNVSGTIIIIGKLQY